MTTVKSRKHKDNDELICCLYGDEGSDVLTLHRLIWQSMESVWSKNTPSFRTFWEKNVSQPEITVELTRTFLSMEFVPMGIISALLYPQWGAEDAEIKVPSVENKELKGSPFKVWSRSVYSYTCCAYCQGFLPCFFLHVRSIHLHFSNPLPIFPVLAVAYKMFLCRPAE